MEEMKKKMIDNFLKKQVYTKIGHEYGLDEDSLRSIMEEGVGRGLERYYGKVRPYTKIEMLAAIIGGYGRPNRLVHMVEWYTHGYVRAHLYYPFLREDFKENDLVVGVGRDSIPLLAGINLIREKDPRTAYIGISRTLDIGKNVEKTLRKLADVYQNGKVDHIKIEGKVIYLEENGKKKKIGVLSQRLLKRLENLAKIARRERRTVVFLDNGKRGTHILPLKILMKKLFPYVKVETAIFQVTKDWKDYHERIGHVLKNDVFTKILEELPHPVAPYLEVDKVSNLYYREPFISLWKAYITGFRDGIRKLKKGV